MGADRAPVFKPAWWLPGPHAQTLWPVMRRPRRPLALRHEQLELPDGDALELAHLGDHDAPRVLILHGLEGSLHSHYANGLLYALDQAGYNATFMFFRGCNGQPNRLPRSYHSGDTEDPRFIIDFLNRTRGPVAAAVGYSLGGNVLLKYLGEEGEACPLRAAVAVSVPYRLDQASERLDRGASRLYQRYLLSSLKRNYKRKSEKIRALQKVDVGEIKTFREFDDRVTAPLHGFRDADDYYRRASSRQFLPGIGVPTLLLHALDDPFMYPHTAPEPGELSRSTRLLLYPRGGHVGFVSGALPGREAYVAEKVIVDYLREALA